MTMSGLGEMFLLRTLRKASNSWQISCTARGGLSYSDWEIIMYITLFFYVVYNRPEHKQLNSFCQWSVELWWGRNCQTCCVNKCRWVKTFQRPFQSDATTLRDAVHVRTAERSSPVTMGVCHVSRITPNSTERPCLFTPDTHGTNRHTVCEKRLDTIWLSMRQCTQYKQNIYIVAYISTHSLLPFNLSMWTFPRLYNIRHLAPDSHLKPRYLSSDIVHTLVAWWRPCYLHTLSMTHENVT